MSGNGEVSFETYRQEFMIGLGLQRKLIGRASMAAIAYGESAGAVSDLLAVRTGLMINDAQATVPELAFKAATKVDEANEKLVESLGMAEESQEAFDSAFGESTHEQVGKVLELAAHQHRYVAGAIANSDAAYESLGCLNGESPDSQIEESRQQISRVFAIEDIEGTAERLLNGVGEYLGTQGIRPITWAEVDV